jgi:hypothetical protein
MRDPPDVSPEDGLHDVEWTTVEWLEDGRAVRRAGRRRIPAESIEDARSLVWSDLGAQVRRPFRIFVAGLGTMTEGLHELPPGAPSSDTIRGWSLDGWPPSAILRALREASKEATPLALMFVFKYAFELELDDVAPIADLCGGRISEAELDDLVGPRVEARSGYWQLRLRLLQAHRSGESIHPVLHAFYPKVGPLELSLAMEEVFRIRDAAKLLVAHACDPGVGREVDAMLEAALEVARNPPPTEDRTGFEEAAAAEAALEALRRNPG